MAAPAGPTPWASTPVPGRPTSTSAIPDSVPLPTNFSVRRWGSICSSSQTNPSWRHLRRAQPTWGAR
eukprot:7759147-Lingulodinium_polyedra.AAC.1